MNKEKLRVGVIGVGHLGEYHVQKYKAIPNVELVGVVDTNPDLADDNILRFFKFLKGDRSVILSQ